MTAFFFNMYTRGWSRADLTLVDQFLGHLIWPPKFKKGRKRKTSVLHKNNLLYATLFSKLNIESEHINTVNWTQNYHSTLIFLSFCQYLDTEFEQVVLYYQQSS